MTDRETNIPKGALVMVTGVTGFVGYRVRGAVRDKEEAEWLVSSVLKEYFDTDRLELCHVPDMAVVNAYGEAIHGVSAIAYVVSILTMDPDPTKIIPETVAGATTILNAAIKEPLTYNDFATKASLAPPPYEVGRGMLTYMASKALNKAHNEGDGAWIRTLYDGTRLSGTGCLLVIYAVDVKEVALLHVAAILDPEATNARLHAWGHKCNTNDLLTIMRKHYPQDKFIDDLDNQTVLSTSAEFSEPLALLGKWADQDGWRPLEDSTVENVDSIVKFT
ncbi:hypothetical protein ACQKWADRAFT_330074 [Trichoderma austrokoningii]